MRVRSRSNLRHRNPPLLLRSRGRTDLPALIHKHHIAVARVAVDEGLEALQRFRVVDGGLPFAFEGIHQVLHLLFQFFANAQRVVDDHRLQVFQAAFHVVAPDAGALDAVGGTDVEHQETVDVLDQRLAVEVAGQQFSVTEQTGEGTRVTATQVRELSRMAEELRQSVSRFKIA